MKRWLFAAITTFGIAAAACGGSGDKSDRDTEPAATAAAAPTARPTSSRSVPATPIGGPTREASDGRPGSGVGALFGSVFQGGLSGASAGSLGAGDESLKAFLPAESDFPDGYTSVGAYTFSAPATSELGATDMAMTMAVKGDPAALASQESVDFSQLEMLMAMVLRPEDLQQLGDALDEMSNLTEQDIEDELSTAVEGFTVERYELLDASGLGEGGFGIEMTIDMSELGSMLGALGGAGAIDGLDAMTMRMYIFGRGDYAGAVMRVGFTDALAGADDDHALAALVDSKLPH